MIQVSIAGATGYTGLELVRFLVRRPDIQFVSLTSEQHKGKCLSQVFPSLRGWVKHELEPLSPNLSNCDVLFLALPHTASMAYVAKLRGCAKKVIDLSADFRLSDPQVYEEWYQTSHQNPELLKESVYGLPELHRERIKQSDLVANPGCYPTSVILGLAPLIKVGWGDLNSIVADSKSGVSGAGRKESLATQFCEVDGGFSAYSLTSHRHTPEIEQELSRLAEKEIKVTFSPHLLPMTRGILSTLYVNLKESVSIEKLRSIYLDFYKDEPFIRILDRGKYANTNFVAHSNLCDIGIELDTRTNRAVITTAIDNLIKGASGQAIQNMNLMLGLDEAVGLDFPGSYP
jgi:N-acetyl-gamma-glutamyl-phosphate reductase